MTGIIITGHGSFAAGVVSVLNLLIGKPENCEAVNFEPEDSIETLTKNIKAAIDRLFGVDNILVFCDLTGGSPFNTAIQLKMSVNMDMEVIGGANIPMIIETVMSRQVKEGLEELTELAVSTGKAQIIRFVKAEMGEEEEYDE